MWLIGHAGIHEDAALDKCSMQIGYHAADITLCIRASVLFCFSLTTVNIFFYWRTVQKEIAMIYRINFSCRRTFYIGMTETKLANGRVKCKTIYSTTCCIY